MATLQQSVSLTPDTGFPGQIIYSTANSVSTYFAGAQAAPADPVLHFGHAAFEDRVNNPEGQIAIPGANGLLLANFIGFVVRDQEKQNIIEGGMNIIEGDKVAIQRSDEIFVTALVPMSLVDVVYVILEDLVTPTNVGKLTNAAGGAGTTVDVSTLVQLVNPVATADTVVKVRLLLL